MHTYIYIHTYIHTYICIYVYTYIHTYVYTYIHICTYIHAHTHTHTHTNTQIYILVERTRHIIHFNEICRSLPRLPPLPLASAPLAPACVRRRY